MLSALDVAKYFLIRVDTDAGDVMTNLKLQKLLYYAQGFYLAIYGRPLFHESVLKWMHGPVVREVYHEYSRHGRNPIPVPEPDEIDLGCIDDETSEFLDEVYSVYGQYAAWTLRNFTHSEPPWLDAPDGGVIAHESMKEYFLTQIN